MDNKPFADLRHMLDEKNPQPARRHGTARVPDTTVMNLEDARAKMTEMMKVAQDDIPFGSHR